MLCKNFNLFFCSFYIEKHKCLKNRIFKYLKHFFNFKTEAYLNIFKVYCVNRIMFAQMFIMVSFSIVMPILCYSNEDFLVGCVLMKLPNKNVTKWPEN